MQIRDELIVYSNVLEGLVPGAEPAMFMVTLEQERDYDVYQPRPSEAAEELRSSFQIDDGPIVYSQSAHLSNFTSDLTVLVRGTGAEDSLGSMDLLFPLLRVMRASHCCQQWQARAPMTVALRNG